MSFHQQHVLVTPRDSWPVRFKLLGIKLQAKNNQIQNNNCSFVTSIDLAHYAHLNCIIFGFCHALQNRSHVLAETHACSSPRQAARELARSARTGPQHVLAPGTGRANYSETVACKRRRRLGSDSRHNCFNTNVINIIMTKCCASVPYIDIICLSEHILAYS